MPVVCDNDSMYCLYGRDGKMLKKVVFNGYVSNDFSQSDWNTDLDVYENAILKKRNEMLLLFTESTIYSTKNKTHWTKILTTVPWIQTNFIYNVIFNDSRKELLVFTSDGIWRTTNKKLCNFK